MEVSHSCMDKALEKTLKEKLASFRKKVVPLWPLFKPGFVAERLGTALQKLLQRFESARNLLKALTECCEGFLLPSKPG